MRYEIQRGDTLWDLARKYGTTVDEIMRLNPHIKDRNKIYAGRTITLPDPPAAEPPKSPIPAPQPLNVKPPLLQPPPLTTSRPPNLVAVDEAEAARGMDPGIMDPTQIPFLINPTSIAAIASLGPRVLPQAGKVFFGPISSNVVAIPGSKGAAQAMLSGYYPLPPRERALFGPITWRDMIYGPGQNGPPVPHL
jgi:LysM repeat protein